MFPILSIFQILNRSYLKNGEKKWTSSTNLKEKNEINELVEPYVIPW